MHARIIVAALIPALVLGYQVVLCPDNIPVNAPPISIDIQGCPSSPCRVTHGSQVSFTIQFFAAVDTSEMRLAINSTVFGVESPVQLTPELSDACNTIVGNCPVYQGQVLTQSATIPVSTELHGGIPVELKFYISHAPGFYCTCAVVNLIVD